MTSSASKPEFDIGALLGRAWKLFTENLSVLLGGLVILGLVMVVVNRLTFGIGWIIAGGPLSLGYAAVTLKIVRGQKVEFGELFSGFQRFLPAFVANLLITIFVLIGAIACILPGLFVGMIYCLTYFFMADSNQDAWLAMESSRKTTMSALGPWVVLMLMLVGINIAGLIPCGLGLLVTAPISYLVLAMAYEQAVGPTATAAITDAEPTA